MSHVVPHPGSAIIQIQPWAVGAQAGSDVRQHTVEYVWTMATLVQVAEEWRELFKWCGCRNAFLSYEWMSTWWRHWGASHRLMVLLVRDQEGKLVALAPFYLRGSRLWSFGPRALCFIGTQWVGSDHLDLIVAPGYEDSAVKAIVAAVQDRHDDWDYIELADGAEASPVFASLCRAFVDAGMTQRLLRKEPCPYTPLPATFEEFLAGLGSNQRYNFRRRRRALEREAGIVFRAIQGGPELYGRFAALVRLHRLRFESQQRNTFFPFASVQSFHADALRQLEPAGMARVLVLESNGKAIAALYGLSVGKRFAFYQSGMDPAWSRLSVGLVMMGCALEEAIRSNHDEFDFLRSDETYKFQWTKHVRWGRTLCFFKPRMRSRWASLHILARETIKQGLRRYVLPELARAPSLIHKLAGSVGNLRSAGARSEEEGA